MSRLRNPLVLSLVGLVLVMVLTVVHLFTSVLDLPLTHRPDTVSVELPRTGGIFEGAPASYRGVRIGTVSGVELEAGRVVATVALRDGVQVPRSSHVAVRSLSPVGEQYLDFRPESARGPYLADGDTVRADAPDLPVSLAAATAGLDNLLSHVDERDLRVVLRELSLATDGIGDDLASLLVSTEQLSGSLDESWPETRRLLRNGETTGELLAAHRDDLAEFARSARLFTAWLAEFDPELRRILSTAPKDLDTLGTFAEELRPVLPRFLRALREFTGLLRDRDPHLRELTRTLGYGADRFASAFRNDWLHVDLLMQGQKQCHYDTPRRDPMSTDRKPINPDGHCPRGKGMWRGAQHAPPPLSR